MNATANAIVDERRKERTKSGRFKPGNPGKAVGTKDKSTRGIRGMILQALSNVGGVKYLEEQAVKQPVAFLSLVGKVLPLDVTSSDGSMRPVVALYMPDNRRDGSTARVIEHAPVPAIGHDTPLEPAPAQVQPHDTQCQSTPAEASAEPVRQTPSEPACADQSQACEPVSPATSGGHA